MIVVIKKLHYAKKEMYIDLGGFINFREVVKNGELVIESGWLLDITGDIDFREDDPLFDKKIETFKESITEIKVDITDKKFADGKTVLVLCILGKKNSVIIYTNRESILKLATIIGFHYFSFKDFMRSLEYYRSVLAEMESFNESINEYFPEAILEAYIDE